MTELRRRWSDDEVRAMIRAYAARPILWDPDHLEYNSKVLKAYAWASLTSALGETDELEVRRKIANLLASYRRERRTIVKAEKKGETYTSRWFAFNEFNFMRQVHRKKEDSSNSENEDEPTPKRQRKRLPPPSSDVHIITVSPTDVIEAQQITAVPIAAPKVKETMVATPTLKNSIKVPVAPPPTPPSSSMVEQEIKSFCGFLSSKMMGYSTATRQGVQHAIYDVLVRADKGMFEVQDYYHQEPEYYGTNGGS